MPVESVFRTTNPTDSPFQSHIQTRAIVFPVEFQFNHAQFHALRSALQSEGEISFYLIYTEKLLLDRRARVHLLPVDATNTYYNLTAEHLATALLSTRCTWGVLCSSESFALIGGATSFINVFFETLGQTRAEHAREFLEAWKMERDAIGAKIDWIPQLLLHIYGEEEARELLAEARF